MKTIVCNKCKRTLAKTEPSREICATNFIQHIGDFAPAIYQSRVVYDLCDECNEQFNNFISTQIYHFMTDENDTDSKDDASKEIKFTLRVDR